MVPTTLLLTGVLPDGTEVRREIDEDEKGHTFLARVAIRYHPAARLFCLPGADHRGVTLRLYYQLLPAQLSRPGYR